MPQLPGLEAFTGCCRCEKEGAQAYSLYFKGNWSRGSAQAQCCNSPDWKPPQGAADARRRARRRTPCTSSARRQSRCGTLWRRSRDLPSVFSLLPRGAAGAPSAGVSL